VKLATSKNEEEKNDSCLSAAMTAHLVCCLDIMNASYEGLAADAAQYAAKFHLLKPLYTILTDNSFDQRVRFFLRATR